MSDARPSAAHTGPPRTSNVRARTGAVLRLLFALALLALVAWNVPWRDRLLWRVGESETAVAGAIGGDWKANSIAFRIASDAALGSELPPEAVAAHATGQPLAVARAAEDADGWDWRPGLLRVFSEMRAGGLVVALLLLTIANFVAVTRWWRLLKTAGCPATWLAALRLTFIGLFMNLVLPGLTSGDVVKAVLIVREHPERRADALVTVIVDRAIGLIVLLGLAVVVVLFASERFAEVRWTVVIVFASALAAIWLVLHPWPRRVLRVDALLHRLPQKERLRSIDRALRLYRNHPFELLVATLLSFVNHGLIVTAMFALGRSVGAPLTWVEHLGVTAIANTASSLPIAPGGWGVGEALFGYLFHLLGTASALGVAVSVCFRLLNTALGLVGGLFLLLPSGRAVRAEIDAEAVDSAASQDEVRAPGPRSKQRS